MKITEVRVSEANLDSILARSQNEFLGNKDQYPEFRLRFSLGIRNSQTEIKYYEMSEAGEVCSSFLLVHRNMRLNETNLRICFLTQVIVSNKNRGEGLTYKISEYAEKMALRDGVGVTFVVARRAVRNLYAKLGFIGFSHFSEIRLTTISDIHGFKIRRTNSPKETDLKKLVSLHEETYSNLMFFLTRSEESFKGLLELPNYRVRISEDASFYFIGSANTIVEIGMSKEAINEEVVATIISEEFECLKLNRNHKIFRFCVELGMQDLERFELSEGHLLKIHKANLSTSQNQELEFFIKHPGAQFAELLEVDQW
jgi:hypothetical protein